MSVRLPRHKTSDHYGDSYSRAYGLLFLLAALAALFTFGMPALRANSQSDGFSDYAGGSKGQIEVVLHADNAPAPGGVANFSFAMKPLRAAPDLTVTWELPDGGELIGGAAEETIGAVAAGATVTQTRQLRFPNPGIYEVQVRASYHPDAATTLSAKGVLFFTIDANGSTASDADPRLEAYVSPTHKPTVDKAGMVVAAGTWGTNVPDGCFNVQGFLTREDRQGVPTPASYVDTTGSAMPVRNMLVEMREEDTFSDDSYGHTVTDALGHFEFNFCDDDGFLNDELELYTRVCAIVSDGHEIARIEQTSEEELYCFDSGTIDSEGGNINFPDPVYPVNSVQAAVFNIGDALFWATKYWNDNLNPGVPRMDRSVTVNWDRATKFAGAFYTSSTKTITLGDDVSDPDEWDDTVIIHEWGHFADDQFSCSASPGGNHNITAVLTGPNADKLAWGEGYGDYIQSAVRTIMPSVSNEEFYIDVDTAVVDLEKVAKASAFSESGIASLLWDFVDTVNDGSDTVNHGPGRITQVITDPGFKNNPACNMVRFIQVWKDLSMPTDAATADTITQNVKIAKPFGVAAAAASAGTAPLSLANLQALDAAPPQEYRWWDQVTMVVDDSTSMGLPAETPKINAVKTLIQEQVADLTANPKGTEVNIYRFNDASREPSPVGEGLFFPVRVDPALDTLQPTGADGGCPTYGLYALSQAVQDKYDGQAWLYTDGDAAPYTSVDYIQQQLNNRQINGSVVLLGGCSSAPTDERSVTGPEVNFLGLAATGLQTGGIVPYLLTAIGTGGNFLYVAPDQLDDAAAILRAQASHSAGAGKWSDYVSLDSTYRWDKLASWEYNWINPSFARGQSVPNDLIIDGLPTMTVYGETFNKVHITDYGVIGMGDPPTPSYQVSRDLYPLFNFDIDWFYDYSPALASANSPDAPHDGYKQTVYADDIGEWVVFTISGEDEPSRAPRAFQALINKNTGEIRYQYQSLVPGDSAGALIGVSKSDFSDPLGQSVYASVNDVNGATPGMGYKFIPAPPQPSKSYVVSVDSQMSGVGFLLTGYSGYLNPLSIAYPDGTLVDCMDTDNVLCIPLSGGLVQYVQVNVNGNGGDYVATVSGDGTFSFNAMAASAIQAKGLGKRTQSFDSHLFQMDLGRTSDDGMLEGWLQTTAGARFGSGFAFYDDGAHEDGEAGDGLFGSDAFMPPGQGVGYLWVKGSVNGETITRSDPAPYNFQPIKVEPALEYVQAMMGIPVTVAFVVTNQDSYTHCYNWEVEVPTRFIFQGSSGGYFCVSAGGTAYPNATFTHIEDGLAEGGTAEINANFYEAEEGRIVGGATTTVAFVNRLGDVEFDNREVNTKLRPNSTDTVTMSVKLLDNFGNASGWSGALGYTLDTTLGTVVAPTGAFENGRMPIVFTSGDMTGTALITFVLEGGSTTTTTLQIRDAVAKEIDLVATPTDLRGEGQDTADLLVTLRDAWGDPVVGQNVRLSMSDDDGREVNGAINGESVLMATTDANGQVRATFTKGQDLTFLATVHAEALVPDGATFRVSHEDSETLIFSGKPPGSGNSPNTFIPYLSR